MSDSLKLERLEPKWQNPFPPVLPCAGIYPVILLKAYHSIPIYLIFVFLTRSSTYIYNIHILFGHFFDPKKSDHRTIELSTIEPLLRARFHLRQKHHHKCQLRTRKSRFCCWRLGRRLSRVLNPKSHGVVMCCCLSESVEIVSITGDGRLVQTDSKNTQTS